jgi:hypothetical protein
MTSKETAMTSAKARWASLGFCFLVAAAGVPAAAQQGEMTAEQKAQMEAWTKAATPGPEHARLAGGVGTWNATVTIWDAPGAPPQLSQAKSVRRLALGGRVLVDDFTGSMMGMPFEGLGTNGYDNVEKKWWSTWSDNMSTGLMTMTGACDADAKKGCEYRGSMADPVTGKAKPTHSKVFWPADGEEHFEMFDKGPDGKEFRIMEIVAKRAK